MYFFLLRLVSRHPPFPILKYMYLAPTIGQIAKLITESKKKKKICGGRCVILVYRLPGGREGAVEDFPGGLN